MRDGETECGTSVEGMPVYCSAGQYCATAFINECSLGCLSDENCAANQECIKPSGQNVGVCEEVDPCANVNCDAGQQCVAGACMTPNTCANVSCGQGEVCRDGQCYSTDPCEGVQCNAGQLCNNGQCVSQPTTCHVTATAQDGCPSSQICGYNANDQPQCTSFPACGPSNTCAPGLYGAVCSSEFIAGKTPMCLPNVCLDDTHCPAQNFCIRDIHIDPIGFCDIGTTLAECYDDSDCRPGLECEAFAPGDIGNCIEPF